MKQSNRTKRTQLSDERQPRRLVAVAVAVAAPRRGPVQPVLAAVLVLAAVGLHLGAGPHDHQLLLLGVALRLDGLYGEHHLLVAAVVAGVGVHGLRGRGHLLQRTERGAGRGGTATGAATHRDPVLGVDAHVLGQVVGAHEALAALGALEALLARVRAPVPLQLVRAREAAHRSRAVSPRPGPAPPPRRRPARLTVSRRTASCTGRAARRSASAGARAGATSCRTPCCSRRCGTRAASCGPRRGCGHARAVTRRPRQGRGRARDRRLHKGPHFSPWSQLGQVQATRFSRRLAGSGSSPWRFSHSPPEAEPPLPLPALSTTCHLPGSLGSCCTCWPATGEGQRLEGPARRAVPPLTDDGLRLRLLRLLLLLHLRQLHGAAQAQRRHQLHGAAQPAHAQRRRRHLRA